MKLSLFGEKFSSGAGILSLMDDLGKALAEGDKIMMGGGNPGHVPLVQDVFRQRLLELTENPEAFRKLIGIYDTPQGDFQFILALADFLRHEFGWQIGPENICLTNGSQNSFFMLFNMFAGDCKNGIKRKVLLPLTPEYIGYADQGLTDNFFHSIRPRIELKSDNLFKYRVDFDRLDITDDIGAICVSRPTNPTGNVLTDDEVDRLARIASENGVPLILDNAYGVPFPGIVYTEATPFWNEEMIVCMSLSKFGLPAARTGIVVARQDIIKTLTGMNAIMNLAPGGFGAMLATDIVKSGEILRLSQEVVKPFYQEKKEKALEQVYAHFKGFDYLVHVPEGAMFLWIWFKDLPISSDELYRRLRKQKVLVVSGHYFFPGLDEPEWKHTRECIRVTYSQDEEDVRRGIEIIAQEIRSIYSA